MAPATVAGSPHTDFGHAPAIPKGQFTSSVRTDREAGSVTCPARLKSPIIPARRTVRAARRPSIALGSMSPIGGSKRVQALTEQVSVHQHLELDEPTADRRTADPSDPRSLGSCSDAGGGSPGLERAFGPGQGTSPSTRSVAGKDDRSMHHD